MAKRETHSFENGLQELEKVVNDLEGGELGLDESLARYERGVRLLTHCRSLLDVAERKVALLTGVDESGKPITETFDASATIDREAKQPAPEPEPTEPRPATIEPPFDPT